MTQRALHRCSPSPAVARRALQGGARSTPLRPPHQSHRTQGSAVPQTGPSRASSPCGRDCWRPHRARRQEWTAWSDSSAQARSPRPSASRAQNPRCCECLRHAMNRLIGHHRQPRRDSRAPRQVRGSMRIECGSYPDTHPHAGTATSFDTAQQLREPPAVVAALQSIDHQSREPQVA